MVSSISRRKFMQVCAATGLSTIPGTSGLLQASGLQGSAAEGTMTADWNLLQRLEPVVPDHLTLRAAVTMADMGNGVTGPAWLLNDSLPSPLIRARRGDRFKVTLENELPDSLILHWHGLTPPELMDGHPRLAISAGKKYEYDFTIENRASTYWYHSHAHHRVGKHAYLGVAGLLIVDDEEEDSLQLPSGDREIALILQDRRVDDDGTIIPYGDPDTMEGLIGNEPFGNGINRPMLEVDTALYRFRILNGSNARIFRLARSDNKEFILIGNDAGLIEKPVAVNLIDMGPGERVDVLIDFRNSEVGDRITLGSRAFFISEGIARFDSAHRQGQPMDLMQLLVTRKVIDRSTIPNQLFPVDGPDPADVVRERIFTMTSNRDSQTRTMMAHQINGLTYRMGRIDETVPFGETEIWTFHNQNNFSHPVHLHATHFRVLSRTGGRNAIMPWEKGLKDTILVHPDELVRVLVRFDSYPGLYLLHCHNLEHEDAGMMLNILVT